MRKINTDLIVERINKGLVEADKKLEQLELVNDLLDKIKELATKTMKIDYDPSYDERLKILEIVRYAKTIFQNIE